MMTKAHLKLLDQQYTDSCEDYLRAFCDEYHLVYTRDSWVGGDVGSVACIGEFFIDMEDIRFMLLNDVPWKTYLENMDYNQRAIDLNVNMINLRSWCMGCPRLSAEQLTKLTNMRDELDNLTKKYKEKY